MHRRLTQRATSGNPALKLSWTRCSTHHVVRMHKEKNIREGVVQVDDGLRAARHSTLEEAVREQTAASSC